MNKEILKAMEVVLPLLEQKLLEAPEDISLLQRLSEIYRQQGQLKAAEAIHQKLLSLDPQSPYIKALNHQVIGLEPEDWYSDLFWPTPFVYEENVLPENEYDEILAWCQSKKEGFEAAEVSRDGSIKVDEKFRSQSVYSFGKKEEVKFLSKLQPIIKNCISRLGMENHDIKTAGRQISLTAQGGFGKPHSDGNLKPTQTPLVEFSFLYYLAPSPLAFSGGDLVVYDTNFKLDSYSSIGTKIPFSSNSLVFFPRYFFHEITQVSSELPLAWHDGRFAILFKLLIEEC